MADRKVIIIAGPTACGKTKYAIKKAIEINGEIINCDSIQVYDDLKILTSYPSYEELCMAEHKLFGYLKFNQKTTSVEWAKIASKVIETSFNIGKTPILTGGTGLYINTLINGASPIPNISKENREIASVLSMANYQKLCEKVYDFDNLLKYFIKPENKRQMIKAYEIFLETGKSVIYFYNMPKTKFIRNVSFDYNVINADRQKLYDKINSRFKSMVEFGAVEEVRELLLKINNQNRNEIFKNYPIFNAIGAKEITNYLDGIYSYEQMLEISKMNSRRYAKRQITWFKHQIPENVSLKIVSMK